VFEELRLDRGLNAEELGLLRNYSVRLQSLIGIQESRGLRRKGLVGDES
jgi:hypothetical protein